MKNYLQSLILVVGVFFVILLPYEASAARVGVSFSAKNDLVPVGTQVYLTAQVQDDGEERPTAVLGFSDGERGGVFYGANATACTGELTEPFRLTVNAGTSNKNFCYTNELPGIYTLSVQLYVDDVPLGDPYESQVTIYPESHINLAPLQASYTEEEGISVFGEGQTSETGSRVVRLVLSLGEGCESTTSMSETIIALVEVGDFDFSYNYEIDPLTAGTYSLQAILYNPAEESESAKSLCEPLVITSTYAPEGYVEIQKQVEGYEGLWRFGFEIGDLTPVYFGTEPTEDIGAALSYGFYHAAGELQITELEQADWVLESVQCSLEEEEIALAMISLEEEPVFDWTEGSNTFTVSVTPDRRVLCVVTNRYTPKEVKEKDGAYTGTRVKKEKLLSVAPAAPLVALNLATSCQPLLTSYLRFGWNNDQEEVKKLQRFLSQNLFLVPVTGYFGTLTEQAVKNFQKKYEKEVLVPWGIAEPTGFVYKTTRHTINNLVCANSEAAPQL